MRQGGNDNSRDREAGDAEPPASTTGGPQDVAAEEAFIRGVLARGEAARAVEGKLPAGALYEIVEEPPGQLPKLVRRRFS
jgi:hypothetical protein